MFQERYLSVHVPACCSLILPLPCPSAREKDLSPVRIEGETERFPLCWGCEPLGNTSAAVSHPPRHHPTSCPSSVSQPHTSSIRVKDSTNRGRCVSQTLAQAFANERCRSPLLLMSPVKASTLPGNRIPRQSTVKWGVNASFMHRKWAGWQ